MLTFSQFATLNESTYGTLDNAKAVITTLRKHGFVGYLAGGCVRDFLTGHKPKDIDVVTDATPDEIIQIFPNSNLVGKQFGVVIVNGIDVATFRKDSIAYSDGRRPDEVTFVKTPQEDSNRRDFTINAMFMDPFTGEILDFHGGKLDAKNRLIKAVGNPDDRFTQDHLRMLRADRFAAKLGFDIHPDTRASMERNSHHIAKIDVERITLELTKAMAHDPYRTIRSMSDSGMLLHVIPELHGVAPQDFAVTLKTLSHLGTNVTDGLGLAATLFKLPDQVMKIAKRLKFTNDLTKHITSVLGLQDRITAAHGATLDVLKRLMRETFFPDALKLYGARVAALDPHAHSDVFHYLTNLSGAMSHEDLHPEKFVTGDDLVILGMKPGKDFARILTASENGQLTGHIKTKAQALEMIRAGHL